MLSHSEKVTPFRKHFIPFVFIIFSISFVYANSINASFHLDDLDHIVGLRLHLHISDLSFQSLAGTFYLTPEKQKIYRPIPCLTIGLNYYFGKEDVFGYHIVNIGIHILCSIAVYVFLYTLLSIPGIKPEVASRYRYEVAAIAAFMFALHPIQTNVATYIIQRMTSLAALFYISSFTAYLRFRLGTFPGRKQTGMKTYTSLGICLLSALFAVLSKENTVTLPVIIMFADYLFFYRISSGNSQKIARWVYAVFTFLALLVLAYAGPKYLIQSLAGYHVRDFTLFERLLTETRIIFFYLYILVIPNIELLNLNHDFPVSSNIFSPPQTLFAIMGIVFLIFLAYRFRRKNNLITFAIVWYLGNLVIESTIIPLELIFEHRTYLPGVLVFCLLALGIVAVGHRIHRQKAIIVFTAIMLIFYGSATVLRNTQFRSELSLWLDAVDKAPNSSRAIFSLGNAYMNSGYPENAKIEYEKALLLMPGLLRPSPRPMKETLLNLGDYYLKKGDFARAEKIFKKALVIGPIEARLSCIALYNLAETYVSENKLKKAAHFYQAALNRLYLFSPAIHRLGVIKNSLGEKKPAENLFKHGIRIDPGYRPFYMSLALLYANEDRYKDAIKVLDTYLSKNKPTNNMTRLLKDINKKRRDFESAQKNSDSKNQ